MNQTENKTEASRFLVPTMVGILVTIGVIFTIGPFFNTFNEAKEATSLPPTQELVIQELPSTPTIIPVEKTSTPIVTISPTTKPEQSPTSTPTPTITPTPTLDLTTCNAAGCGSEAIPLPTAVPDFDLLLANEPFIRRTDCPECPANPLLSTQEIEAFSQAPPSILAQMKTIVLSQETYEIAPGIVYVLHDYAHHVVIDLEAEGYLLRNIIPEQERGTLITPSYCFSPRSLVVTDADYHGLNGSNKTETGRDLFFHLGRAALYKKEGQFDLDVIREREIYDQTTISWGGGPIFIWEGAYNFNPEQEWFDQENLDYYRDTRWAKMSVALSQDRKYLFLTVSYDLSLEEHAENIITLGQKWGITVDKAMRFDGGESAFLAIRIGDYLVPLLNLEEPLIVNCLAVERSR